MKTGAPSESTGLCAGSYAGNEVMSALRDSEEHRIRRRDWTDVAAPPRRGTNSAACAANVGFEVPFPPIDAAATRGEPARLALADPVGTNSAALAAATESGVDCPELRAIEAGQRFPLYALHMARKP